MNCTNTSHRAVVIVLFVGGVISPWLRAQSPSPAAGASGPAFDVASVKASKADEPESILPRGDQFVATNATLRNLITTAYGIPWYRVVNAPNIVSDRFDVIAKMPKDAPNGSLGVMLQALLADRFALKTHPETRDLPIYALIVANRGGQLGPNLHRSAIDCPALAASGQPIPARHGDDPPVCGTSMNGGRLTLGGMPMRVFANLLFGPVGREVIDRTGLTGNFDLNLQWNPDPNDPNGPSIFTAIQEQLGLKLESTRAPVDVLVIDHVEQPTPD